MLDNPAATMKNCLFRTCPPRLYEALQAMSRERELPLYLSGGTVRDCLLGREANDLDLTVSSGSRKFCRELVRRLGGGTLIDLSVPEEETVRLVWQGGQLDVSSFRDGATTIEEDLLLRDFSINAIAVDLRDEIWHLIDPAGGKLDLEAGIVRQLPGAFIADPLRMLRGFRLAAVLNFSMDAETKNEITRHATFISRVSAERIDYELQRIFDASGTAAIVKEMTDAGLLTILLPELVAGTGVTQPEFHHLDVFDHCLRALEIMEEILDRSDLYFPLEGEDISLYINMEKARRRLKWAALLHDIGKPETRATRSADGRVTFHRHDETGANLFKTIADRLKWSKVDRRAVELLIAMHMRPFHLYNVYKQDCVTKKAALHLYHQAGSDLPGLFLLAMADSLASEGEKKPQGLEEDLSRLYRQLRGTIEEFVRPVVKGPRYLNGRDLIGLFQLEPGPLLGTILDGLEVAQVEGIVIDRASAIAWTERFLLEQHDS